MRNISENGLAFAAAWEQFAPIAYRATAKEQYLTIGFGHYGKDVYPGMRISRADALELLRKDMAKVNATCDKYVSHKFNQAQYDAIVDLCFNAGTAFIIPDNVKDDFDDAVRFGQVERTRAIMSTFIYQKGVPMLGLKRRTAGRLALFDGKHWKEAEEIGRMLIR